MTNIDYTRKDYLSLREQMLATARDVLPEWTPAGNADFGLALIESMAYLGDVLAYYSDRIINESFLATAKQRGSLIDIARMLGYEPHGPIPATVELTFGVDATTADVTIPAGTQVATDVPGASGNVVFETDTEVTVTQGGGSSVTVDATEGVLVEDEVLGTATVDANQRFVIAATPVADSSVSVEVDEGAGFRSWIYYPHLLDADGSTPAFTTIRYADDSVEVRFGDGVDGRIPALGATIRATYRIGGGVKGNVGASSITRVIDGVPGVTSVTNLAAASGGEDSESTDDIRTNAPVASRTNDRAVSLRDFKDLASVVPGVAHAAADSDVATNVIVYVAPNGLDQPALSASLQQAVEDELAEKALLGVSTTVLGPTYVPIDVDVSVQVEDTFSQTDVQTRVEQAITDLYALSNVAFGKTLPVSDLYRAVSQVEGVLYLTVDQHERDFVSGPVVTNEITHTIDELPYLNDATINVSGGVLT